MRSLYYANVVWPISHYEAVNRVPYGLGIFNQYWRHWIIPDANWSVGMAAVLITPFLFVAALPLILAILCIICRKKTVTPELVLYLACGAALWVSEMHRRDIYHLVFGSSLLLILSVFLLNEINTKWSSYALQLLAIASACLATFNLFSVLITHTMPTRVGPVAVYKDNGVVAYLDSHTVPGEEIFSYPYCPIYYFLSATSNPTRYLTLTYNYNPTSEFNSVIDVLEQHQVRYVIWDAKFLASTAPLVFSKAALTPPDGFLMEAYLQAHYKTVKDADGFRIMERKHNDRE